MLPNHTASEPCVAVVLCASPAAGYTLMMQPLVLVDAALALSDAAANFAAVAAAVPLCCGRWGCAAPGSRLHMAGGWGCAVMPSSAAASCYTVSTAQQQQQQQQLGLSGSCRQLALAGRAMMGLVV
jgi:hypothetical protein